MYIFEYQHCSGRELTEILNLYHWDFNWLLIANTPPLIKIRRNNAKYFFFNKNFVMAVTIISFKVESVLIKKFRVSWSYLNFHVRFDLIWFIVLNATFSNISAISWQPVFSGGRSRSTRRESPTMGKQLVNFITCGCESSAPFFVHTC